MNKHTLLRNTLRSGFRAKGRFLSLFGIIAISTGFFAGLKATSPDMKDSAEQYYRDTHLMDLHLVSNVGFSEQDLDLLAANDAIRQLCGGCSETVFLPVGDDAANSIVRIETLTGSAGKKTGAQINQPVLTEGRMPQTANECLIEVNTPSAFQIGDTLRVVPDDADSSNLAVTDFTVVGRADWSMYVDFQRGSTTIGNGSIDSFLLVLPQAFSCDYYTDVYLTLTAAEDLNSFSDRYLTVVRDAADAILEKTEEYAAGRAGELTAQAEEELADARAELDDGWDAYADGEAELEQALADAQAQLDAAAQELADGDAELAKQREAYDKASASYEEMLQLFGQREASVEAAEQEAAGMQDVISGEILFLDQIVTTCAAYRETALTVPYPAEINDMIAHAATFDSDEFSLSDALTAFFSAEVGSFDRGQLEETIDFYAANCKANLQNQAAEMQENAQQIVITRNELEFARAELAHTKEQLISGLAELETAENELKAAKAEYESEAAELRENETEKRAELAEAKAELESAEADYAEAEDQISHIAADITWYAFDRSDNPGWSSYGEDADRVDRIARIFPVFFLLVAALVCLTTMTRMVEEQRTEIGTCKALGYSAGAISVQYLLYAAGASILGTAVGTTVGCQVFPRVIFVCYEIMYHYPPIRCPYHWGLALICLTAALLCTGLTAMIACGASLTEVPAMLMRPKPPKQGKRILLEKWKWLWSKCSFHVKVTIRNFCRYRSRVLMTMLGICGCTALLVTGFGLYHAIAAIVDLHFGEIFRYDLTGLYDGSSENRAVLSDLLEHTTAVTEYQFGALRSGTARANYKSYEVNLLVTEHPETLSNFITLRDRKTHEGYALSDDGVIINEKLARLLDLSVGDNLALADGAFALPVTAICENYAYNYVFLTDSCYAALFGEYTANCFFANENSDTDENALAEHILQSDALLRLNFTSQSGNGFRDLVKALGYVVALIIIFSGLLAFVVLYNLAHINILERMRELATIKVLGFYDNEVNAYIFRENLLSSFCGMLCGLFAGIFLCRYVVRTAEVDVVMFVPDIPWYCFVLAAVITMAFTLLVNLMLHIKLRQIDMAGSMKAIE